MDQEEDGFFDVFKQDQKAKQMVDNHTPEDTKTKINTQKLKLIRQWLLFVTIGSTLFGLMNLLKKEKLPLWQRSVLDLLCLGQWICLVYSKCKDISSIYLGMVLYHIRNFMDLYLLTDVMTMESPTQEVYTSFTLFFIILMQQNFLGYLFELYRNQLNAVAVVVLVAGLNQRLYGFEDLANDWGAMTFNSFCFLLGIPLYMYVNQSLQNISSQQEVSVNVDISEKYIV